MFDDETFDNRNNAPVPTGNPVDPALDLSRRWRQKSDEWDAAQAALDAIVDGLAPELKEAATVGIFLRDAAGRNRTACAPGPWIDEPGKVDQLRRRADLYEAPTEQFDQFIAEMRAKGGELERCGYSAAKAKCDALNQECIVIGDQLETAEATTLVGFVSQLLALRDGVGTVDSDLMQLILNGVYTWCSSEDVVAAQSCPAEPADSLADAEVEALIARAQADLVDGGLTLTELIAAEKSAWDAQTVVLEKAELPWFAYHKKHPGAPCPWDGEPSGDRPPELSRIAELHRRAGEMTAAANALTDRVVRWIPDSVEDAIQLIEQDQDCVEAEHIYTGLVTWLRAIAGREIADTAASLPEAAAVRLFRDWLAAECRANEIGRTAADDDPEFQHTCKKANRLLDRIFATAATDLPSLAVKAWLRLYEDHPSPGGQGVVDLEDLNGCDALPSELALARDISRILGPRLGAVLIAGGA